MDDPVMWQLWCLSLPSSFRVAGLVPGKMILHFLPMVTGITYNHVGFWSWYALQRRITNMNKIRFHSKLYNGKHCHGNKISGGCCGGKDAAEEENGGRSEGETCGILKPCDGDWAAPVGGCTLGKSPKLTIWVTPHQDARTEGPQRLEKRTCGGDHLFPPSSICLVEGGGRQLGGSCWGVLFLSFCLTWSGAVLRLLTLCFLQAAVVRFLQQPPASVSSLVLLAAAGHFQIWNRFAVDFRTFLMCFQITGHGF